MESKYCKVTIKASCILSLSVWICDTPQKTQSLFLALCSGTTSKRDWGTLFIAWDKCIAWVTFMQETFLKHCNASDPCIENFKFGKLFHTNQGKQWLCSHKIPTKRWFYLNCRFVFLFLSRGLNSGPCTFLQLICTPLPE